MRRTASVILALGSVALTVQGTAGSSASAIAASPSDIIAVERFLAEIEKPPIPYQAHRRLEASSTKLRESAWMEAITDYSPITGLRYSVLRQGGSERIQRRVLKSVLEAEKENSTHGEWRNANFSRANYELNFGGRTTEGMLMMQLNPRRRDARLVSGSALLTAAAGDLVRVEGRLSKSPSFWVRWVNVSRSYSPVGGAMMPVAVESTADVMIAGISTFSMTYDYRMVDGVKVTTP